MQTIPRLKVVVSDEQLHVDGRPVDCILDGNTLTIRRCLSPQRAAEIASVATLDYYRSAIRRDRLGDD